MEERFVRGFVAGIVGGVAANAWSFFSGAIGFTSLRFVDWSSIMIYGHRPPFSSGEILFGLVGNMILCGVMGIVFAFLIPQITSKNLLLKGWIFAETSWFIFYAVSILFRVEGVAPIPLRTAISDFISASFFGLVQAYVLQKITVDSGVRHTLVPAMKPLGEQDDDQGE